MTTIRTNMIPLSECKHGYLYKIVCRKLSIGVFNEKTNGFVGIREKFGDEYLFTEYHWDTGAPFGTVQPSRLIEQCPVEDLSESHLVENTWQDNKPLFDYLKKKEIEQ